MHSEATSDKPNACDVIVYGATSAGIIAAVQSARMGRTVLVLEPGNRIGGMTTGGLSDTDAGIEASIGGLAMDFYTRVGAKYGISGPTWFFEPKVALAVFQDLLREHDIRIVFGERLARGKGVTKTGQRIIALATESGRFYAGKQFIDATYEGDLMAEAGVSYTTGREANCVHGETLNGIRPENELPRGIDPYRMPGDATSGLLNRVNESSGGEEGGGDKKVQAYNFRMCLTDLPENRVMIKKPEEYDESDYEILFRAIQAGQKDRFFKFRMLPRRKTDSNNDSGISTDYIGINHDYPEADYATREAIRKSHEVYQKGFVWTLQNHPRVPAAIREYHAPWGLPLDEFVDSGHWPRQLYVREARRMVSGYVITEHIVRGREAVSDPVGLGSYAMDSHHVQYCVGEDGFLRTDGGFYTPFDTPYQISIRALLPKPGECANLIVPVCVSATHAAYGSVRMEPVFMILGQSAATAACLALEHEMSLQELPYAILSKRLCADRQVLACEFESETSPEAPSLSRV